MAPSQQQKKAPQAAEISGSATRKSSAIKEATTVNANQNQNHHRRIVHDQHLHAIKQSITLTGYALLIANAWEGSNAGQHI